MAKEMTKAVELSLTFTNGTKVSCANRAGFDSLFDAMLNVRNADTQLESLRAAFVHELIEKENKATR